MTNYQRYVTMGFLLLAVIAWVFMQLLVDTVWDLARWPVLEDLPLSPAQLIGLLAGGAVLIGCRRNQRVNGFANEAAAELAKVTWAPRKETLLSTGVIAVVVAVCSLLLLVVDTAWGTLVRLWYR
ncbi:MAG: preprotein translocase subunit SecE [Deltaproteobacteria bacterium]|nr:preprotein translocase subunit SecE [Deltaproteobacteria bacterium]